MQNLKAVTMSMATARAPFWSNKPNPATHPNAHMAAITRVTPNALAYNKARYQQGKWGCELS
jgi:hypothetical protein